MDDNRLRILIESVLDERGFKKSEEALKKLEKQAGEVGEATKKSGGGMSLFMDASLGFVRTFGTVVGVVAGGMAPIAKSAQEYVNTVKLANATSREWLATTYQIEQAQLKIGKINAEFFTPIYSKYGDLYEKMAKSAKQNPEATLTVEAIGGIIGTVGVGALLNALRLKLFAGAAAAGATAVTNTAIAGATSTALAATSTAVGTGAAVGTGTAVGAGIATGGAVSIGTVLGVVGLIEAQVILSQHQFKEAMKVVQENEKKGLTEVKDPNKMPFWDRLAGSMQAQTDPYYWLKQAEAPGTNGEKDEPLVAKTFSESMGELVDQILTGIQSLFTGTTTSGTVAGKGGLGPLLANNPTGKSEFMPVEYFQMQMNFRKQELYSQQDYNRQLSYTQEDFLRNRNYQEMDFNRQTGIQERNFNIQQLQSEEAFYLQRAIAQRDYQISVSRNDYDYALSRKRAQEDQNFSLKQIMLSGDALAYYYSQRQFNLSKQRAEEDYQLQKQRAQEDFNGSQADSAYMFGIQRQFAQQQFNISMADRENEYKITRQRAEWEFNNVTLKRMDEEYRIAAGRRIAAFNESLLPAFLYGEDLKLVYQNMYRDISIQGYVDAATAMQTYFNQIVMAYTRAGYGSSPRSEGRASGGYVDYGMYQLHDHEYVLNKSTTKSLESVAQGRLTQEKVLGLLTGGGSGMVYNDNRQFSRGLSIDEKIMLKQELRQMVVEAFR